MTPEPLVSQEFHSYSVWADPVVRQIVHQRWTGPAIDSLEELPDDCPGLVVAGGGRMMDEAKYFRATRHPGMKLVLVPSLWGSGAERSPITVLNRDGVKQIHLDPAFLPDDVIYWPELLTTVPLDRARQACGDVWAHALESFLSPLGTGELYQELAELMRTMLALPLSIDARWFEASGRACQLQAKASVGLVHGIAHVLEPAITAEFPSAGWGHARLCSVFLLPVMELNRKNSAKYVERAAKYGLPDSAVEAVLRQLFEPEAYRQALPLLKEKWPRVLRDPCTRTNGTLVRPQAIGFFEEWLQ